LPELRESSARMLRVTGGWWPRNVPIPRAAGEDFFTSRMVREWKVFPYGRNIAAVVSAVMDKDRQGAAQKRQAVVRLHEARPKRQRGAAKAVAPGGGKPPLAAKSGVPASSKAPEAAAGAGGSKSTKAVPSLLGRRQRLHPSLEAFADNRWSDRDRTGRDTLRSIRHQTKTGDEVILLRGLVQLRGPRVIWPIVTGPAWPPLCYGPNL
jgi:hypothetical protein